MKFFYSGDLFSLLVLQIEAVDGSIAKPLKKILKGHKKAQKSIVVSIWEHIIPWHTQVTAAWADGNEVASPPILDVNFLSGISITQHYKNKNPSELSESHLTLLLQTGAIAGQLLLIIGLLYFIKLKKTYYKPLTQWLRMPKKIWKILKFPGL